MGDSEADRAAGPASDPGAVPRGEAPESIHAPLASRLARLEAEREAAQARYNAALTELDRAIRPSPPLPPAAAGVDGRQLPALNDAWNILPAPPDAPGGFLQKLTGFVWRIVGPSLQRQLTFNSLLVDHLNRTAAAAREAHAASEALIAALGEQAAATAELQTRLIVFLQQITPYVDTSSREAAGRSLIINEALSGVADEADRRWESIAAWQKRIDAAVAALMDASATGLKHGHPKPDPQAGPDHL